MARAQQAPRRRDGTRLAMRSAMSRPSASPFCPPTFCAVRTPTLPLATWAQLSEPLRAPSAPAAELAAALAHDRTAALDRLRDVLREPFVREAIGVASPSLDEALDGWFAGRDADRSGDVVSAAFRYVVRMATRATPFGLFAAHALGRVAEETVVVAPGLSARRDVRLDGGYLAALAEALTGDPALRSSLRFGASNAAYVSGGQVRYAEGRVDPATRARRNDTVSVAASDALTATLARAATPATRDGLAGFVASHTGAGGDEASAWVDALVEAGLLTPELAPSLTGEDHLTEVTAWLRSKHPRHPALPALREVARGLDALRGEPLGAPLQRYEAIAAALGALPCPAPRARLFQVDLHGDAASTLGREVAGEVARVAETLATITPWRESPDLTRFRERFTARWEGDAVPLTVALDEERGVGFGDDAADGLHPLLDGLDVRVDPDVSAPRMTARDRWIHARLHGIAAAGEGVWVLTSDDLARLRVARAAPMPDAFAVIAARLPPSQGPIVHFEQAAGPSGARLMGRFCRGDEALAQAVREHLRAEEALRPGAVFAEVVHLPQGRIGNIARRPALRAWEIPYLCRAGVDDEHAITVDDLLVRVEPGGRIALFSKRLQREVVPRMTNAHQHDTAELPIYRFLCALITQGVRAGLAWSWGALEGAPHLPRVVLGRAVVSPATWNVAPAELAPLTRLPELERRLGLRAWRSRRGVPRVVSVCEGDNALRLDLENPLAADALLDLARGAADLLCLREVLGDAAAHAHELVIPFVRRAATPPPPPAPPPAPSTVRRAFAPGSEWLYAKVYVGALTADALLADVVAPLVRELRARGAVDGWFFVRYADPEPHLRLRLHGDPRALLGEALPALHAALAPWLDDGRVARVALDTYVREVERYGGDEGVARCEAIFEAQSDAALAAIAATRGDEGRDGRWRRCLAGLDALLRGLGCDRARAAAILESQRDAWARQLGVTRASEGALSRRFRAERAALEAELADAPGSAAWAGLIGATAARAVALRVGGGVPDGVAASLLHMWVNRVMPGAQNLHEVALYDLLARLYRSELARTSRACAARTHAP